jgi:hypothetical protein
LVVLDSAPRPSREKIARTPTAPTAAASTTASVTFPASAPVPAAKAVWGPWPGILGWLRDGPGGGWAMSNWGARPAQIWLASL